MKVLLPGSLAFIKLGSFCSQKREPSRRFSVKIFCSFTIDSLSFIKEPRKRRMGHKEFLNTGQNCQKLPTLWPYLPHFSTQKISSIWALAVEKKDSIWYSSSLCEWYMRRKGLETHSSTWTSWWPKSSNPKCNDPKGNGDKSSWFFQLIIICFCSMKSREKFCLSSNKPP